MVSPRDQGFSRLSIKNGFMTRDQVDEVFSHLSEASSDGADAPTFEDYVVEHNLMSGAEAAAVALAYQRLIKDAEKRRWSVSGYEIFNKIGEGGLGVVFKARQISMNRIVALKILHKRWLNDEEFKQRFLIEARLVGKLSHQNLIKVFDVGKEDWKYYFSMEFIEGETLEEKIEREGPIEVVEAIELILQVLRAIRYLSKFDIVHCDIKPSNILLTRDEIAKLGDFGFVKTNIEIQATEEGSVLGTPDYISPEQAMGEKDLDFRSDLYSLGVTFYHMLSAQPPFEGTVSTVMRKHIRTAPPSLKQLNPNIPKELCRIVEKMMAKSADERFDTCEQLFEELELIKIRLKTGKDYNVDKSMLVEAIEMHKDRATKAWREKLDVIERLKRARVINFVLGGLLALSVVTLFVVIFTSP